jgi:hypothetical protein
MGRRALVLLVALLLAGVAAFAVYTFVNNYQAEQDALREQSHGVSGYPSRTRGPGRRPVHTDSDVGRVG